MINPKLLAVAIILSLSVKYSDAQLDMFRPNMDLSLAKEMGIFPFSRVSPMQLPQLANYVGNLLNRLQIGKEFGHAGNFRQVLFNPVPCHFYAGRRNLLRRPNHSVKIVYT